MNLQVAHTTVMGVRNAPNSVDQSDKLLCERSGDTVFLDKYLVEWEETELNGFVYSAASRLRGIEVKFWP